MTRCSKSERYRNTQRSTPIELGVQPRDLLLDSSYRAKKARNDSLPTLDRKLIRIGSGLYFESIVDSRYVLVLANGGR
jgi:hypothetical protein